MIEKRKPKYILRVSRVMSKSEVKTVRISKIFVGNYLFIYEYSTLSSHINLFIGKAKQSESKARKQQSDNTTLGYVIN